MRRSTLLLLSIFVLVAAMIGSMLFLSYEDLNAANPGWNGMMSLSFEKSVRSLSDMAALQSLGKGSTLLIISPSEYYTPAEAENIVSFMGRGGFVVLADDYGTGGSLLESIMAPVSIDKTPLCQDDMFYKNRAMPMITDIIVSDITADVSTLYLNHPVSLVLKDVAAPIAMTSDVAYLDKDDDGYLGTGEASGKFCVISEAAMGEGRLVVIGDPDIFINIMLDKGDNAALANNIMSAGTVYMDTAHGQSMPPLASIYHLMRYDLLIQSLTALLAFAAGLVYVRRKEVFPRFYVKADAGGKEVRKRALLDYVQGNQLLMEKDIKELNKRL